MEALLNRRVSVIATLLIAATLCGCRSGGSRLAKLNPWRSSGEDATAIARTAPELPSTQVAQTEAPAGSGAKATTGSDTKAPAFNPSASTLAAAPAAQYPTTNAETPKIAAAGSGSRPGSASRESAAGYPTTTAPTTVAAAAPTATTQAYDPNSYPATAAAPAAPTGSGDKPGPATSGSGRYAQSTLPAIPSLTLGEPTTPADGSSSKPAANSRYAATTPPSVGIAAPSTSPSESLANTTPPTTNIASSLGSLPAYPSGSATQPTATPSITLPPTAPLSSNPLASITPTNLGAVTPAQATLPAGGYRPGGTSTYTPPAVSLASRPQVASPQLPATPTVPPVGISPQSPAPATGISLPPYPVTNPYPSTNGYR